MRPAFLVVLLLVFSVRPGTAQLVRASLDHSNTFTPPVSNGFLQSATLSLQDDDSGSSTAGTVLLGGAIGAYIGVVFALATLDCKKWCPILGVLGAGIGAAVGALLASDDNESGDMMPMPTPRKVKFFSFGF